MITAFEIHWFISIGKPVNLIVFSNLPSFPVKNERTVIYIVPTKNSCRTAYDIHMVFFAKEDKNVSVRFPPSSAIDFSLREI